MEQCPVFGIPMWIMYVIITVLTIWDLVWKLIALWKAGRNNQLGWFICLAIINSVGILPIIYLLMQKKKNTIDE